MNFPRRSVWHSASTLGFLLATGGMLAPACDDDGEAAGSIVFADEATLFPDLSFDTGLLPADSPVQASFAVSATGTSTITANAMVSEANGTPTLTGLAKGGSIDIAGGFALTGRLVVDVSGLSYDGPIPGLDNVAIEFDNSVPFDPFSIGVAVPARAEIPPADLPAIPLPGGIPGSLVLTISEGSFVEVSLTGNSACVAADEARYGVTLGFGGSLVIEPSVEIDVPIVGTKTFSIPAFTVPLALGSTDLAMSATFAELGDPPAAGDSVTESCSGSGGAGGAGGGTSDGGGPAGGGITCTAAADCPDALPCVEGTCSEGGGICQAGMTHEDPQIEACYSQCCTEFAACTYDYADLGGCNDCLANGAGPRCDPLLDCLYECIGATEICDSGFFTDPSIAECTSENCCGEFNACTFDGSDPAGCNDCMVAGSGPRCDSAIECAIANSCI